MTDGLSPVTRWFHILVKNKMAGAALPIAGISIGGVIVESTHVMPEPWAKDIGDLGYFLMSASVLAFVFVTFGYALVWLRYTWNARPIGKRKS